MILVDPSNYKQVLKMLSMSRRLSLDTETGGLEPFKGDKVFSIAIADESNEYYFDFTATLSKYPIMSKLEHILNQVEYLFFINFDYDFSMLAQDEMFIDKSKILDGGVLARLEYSLHQPSGSKAENQFFSMDYLAKYYLGKNKDTTVEDYIKEHKLYGEDSKGKKKPLYIKVPLRIMYPYGCSDARLTFDICTEIIRRINGRDLHYETTRPKTWPKIMDVLGTESKLSTALAATKLAGFKLDKSYCEEARVKELANSDMILAEIRKTVNLNVNSPKQMQGYLRDDLGLTLPKIIKRGVWTGGYSTDAKTLDKLAEKHDLPVLNKIVAAKRSQKKANTYYKNYLAGVDNQGFIHCGLGQETTITGRLSSYSPNLQNVHKEKYHDWAVRKAFVTIPDFKIFCLDYKGQEMYIMIDLSGDQQIIDEVKSGVDIYVAMANMVERHTGIKITREQAKKLALGVAYGQGAALIASNLGCSVDQAKKLRTAFKASLKGVNALDIWCKNKAKLYSRIHNPYGRVTHIDKGFEYKALNALIQSSAADCTKKAFVDCFEFLKDYKSRIVLSVHDELIFYIHNDEENLIPALQEIMINAYPHRHLPLRVDVEVSSTSWAEKVDYIA